MDTIFNYVGENFDTSSAQKALEKIFKAFQSIAEYPKIGSELISFNLELINHCFYRQEKNSILYEVEITDKTILILHVFSNREVIIEKIAEIAEKEEEL
ncbi:type II toxin-antitoxin system RelE/ParE family toxin [Enterococcus sp.]|uniref:type II toxin-antitoxin system RelE/ParE family toxin n=1 Tax=Enterococcus sp. TaxID=35783 RepID=UPI00290E31C5|nr:type II toxin-antitoxin system RelE/ParE family toxin [Enterococcus sp.]MDU5336222.1 type II toxin-antitoxin system RelE/ParE family toxin [Enterococcus sp.]